MLCRVLKMSRAANVKRKRNQWSVKTISKFGKKN